MNPESTTDPIANITTHRDGSGNALANEEHQLEYLNKAQMNLDALRAFLVKHREKLAGSSWSLALYELHKKPLGIEWFCHGDVPYRGEKFAPLDFIAHVWPDLEWKRVKHKWSNDEYRDYAVETEGVELRITYAERSKPVKVTNHKPEGRLRIPKTATTP